MSRCIRALSHSDPNRDPKQTAAICYSTFRRKEALHPDFERILNTFVSQYGENGISKFEAFVKLNNLKVDKAYTPQAQFKESFSWVEPLISVYKQDKKAKYYKVTALTANISMNNNDYSDYTKMQQAAPTLTYRPVNLNHNHDTWLPFPRTRVDFTKAEDMSVEGTLRVDNEDAWLQRKLDNGDIAQVSIEGRPDPNGMGEGYHFTGLALLERGVELPGDPLTEIQPLFLNESVGRSMCKLINGDLICGPCKINKKEEKNSMSEVQDELTATGKCVCPFCGQVDVLGEKDCSLQKCSRDSCGHQMQIQTDRASKKEAFGDASFPDSCFAYVPDSAKGADGNKSDRKLPYKNADGSPDIPHVRNALARLDQTDGIPSQEKERIRNMLQNILKRESPEYEPSEKTDVVPLIRATIQEIDRSNLEHEAVVNNLKADFTEKEASWTREKVEYETKIREQNDMIATQSDKNAELTRENRKIILLEEQKKGVETKNTTLAETVDKLQGQNETYARQIGDLEKERNKAANRVTQLNEKTAGLETEVEKLHREVNEESQKRATSEQKALNETKERSRIQLENADLRNEVAKVTREISVLAEKRAEDAKKIYTTEIEKKTIVERLNKREAEIAVFKERLKKAFKMQKWAHNELAKAGIAFVQEDIGEAVVESTAES